MLLSRPLPKSVLKNMFLKCLHELGGPRDYNGIIRHSLAQHFNIDPLSEEEITECFSAVDELTGAGLITKDQTQMSDNFKVLTARGKEVVKESLEEMELPSIDIDQFLSRGDLLRKVREHYLSGDYETAVFEAFKLLEETVRTKANQSPQVIGDNLMKQVFNPSSGILQHPEARTEGEKEGLFYLMRGAIRWFKNPVSHRTVGYNSDKEAAYVLAFANLLLNMVDQC